MFLGGNNGISLSINVSHNFANLSHYNMLDFGSSIILWVLDNDVSKNCDQYLVFNNINNQTKANSQRVVLWLKFLMVCSCLLREVHCNMEELFISIQLLVNYVLQVIYLVYILGCPCQLFLLSKGYDLINTLV